MGDVGQLEKDVDRLERHLRFVNTLNKVTFFDLINNLSVIHL